MRLDARGSEGHVVPFPRLPRLDPPRVPDKSLPDPVLAMDFPICFVRIHLRHAGSRRR